MRFGAGVLRHQARSRKLASGSGLRQPGHKLGNRNFWDDGITTSIHLVIEMAHKNRHSSACGYSAPPLLPRELVAPAHGEIMADRVAS